MKKENQAENVDRVDCNAQEREAERIRREREVIAEMAGLEHKPEQDEE